MANDGYPLKVMDGALRARAERDRSFPVTRPLAWSLVVHALAVVVAALPAVRGWLSAWHEAGLERAAAAVAAVVPIEVAILVPEVVVVRPPVSPPETFIRTDGLPEAAPDPSSRRFISDRDTRAASALPADPSATEAQPTQEGIDIPVVEVIRREQSDGEDESLPPAEAVGAAAAVAAVAAPPAEPMPPADPMPLRDDVAALTNDSPAAEMVAEAVVESTAVAEPMPAPVEERLALTRESDLKVTVEPAAKPAEPVTPARPSPPSPRLREPEVASRPQPPPAPPTPPANRPPAGFSGLRAPTRLRGTISNQGPSSVDAEDTPTGRYMKQVTTAIEKEWHRKRRMHRDFVTFGTIKLEFYVDTRGHVHGLSIKNRSGANAVMQDFTLNAVLDAAIPPMPHGLTEILDRERLLISYDIIVY